MEYPLDWRLTKTKRGTDLWVPPPIQLEFVTHPDAPLFSGTKDDLEIIEMAVRKRSEELTSELLEVFKQAGLASLWFFEKHILGYSGPYTRLNDHLHIDMANFRQALLHPGARGAMLVPRSCFKTTIGTHGANTWEIIRNPEIQILLVGATKPDAKRFSEVVKANFELNELLRELWPEAAPERSKDGAIIEKNWNQDGFIIPSRKRYHAGPTVKILGAGGATAGNHCDLLNVDDLIGDQQLNADQVSTADMRKVKQWFKNNADTLLDDPEESRIFLSATRYAIDDAYDWISEDASTFSSGFFEDLPEECQPHEGGRWDVYYRQAIERDLPIFPEKITKNFLKYKKENDPWGYFTQYLNNPFSAQMTEFSDYEPGYFDLNYDHRIGYTIHVGRSVEREEIELGDCIVSMGVDPAASDRKKTERTSRYAIVVQAKDYKDRRFILEVQAGYWEPQQCIDKMFLIFKRFYPHIKRTNLEKMGAFTIFYDNVMRAQKVAGTYIGLYPVTGGGDKDTKIRNYYQPLMDKNLFFLNNSIREIFMDELRVFPGGTKKDIMDAGTLANESMGIPRDPESITRAASWRQRRKRYTSRVTGA